MTDRDKVYVITDAADDDQQHGVVTLDIQTRQIKADWGPPLDPLVGNGVKVWCAGDVVLQGIIEQRGERFYIR